MNKAVFFDRDGVIARLVLNPQTGEYESSHRVSDLSLYPDAIDSLKSVVQEGYMLFLVSNQPSFAKGKVSLEDIQAVHAEFHRMMVDAGIKFTEYFYCYHHPDGVVASFSGKCECRKPSPYFLLKARDKYGIDLKRSWFIGDRDSDILCGKISGVKTILVEEGKSARYQGKEQPDFKAKTLAQAINIIKEMEDEIA